MKNFIIALFILCGAVTVAICGAARIESITGKIASYSDSLPEHIDGLAESEIAEISELADEMRAYFDSVKSEISVFVPLTYVSLLHESVNMLTDTVKNGGDSTLYIESKSKLDMYNETVRFGEAFNINSIF